MTGTDVTRRLGIDLPIIQAPMAGGPSTVALASAVSDAGAMGSLAGGYLAPDELRRQIRLLRSMTPRPFAVNLFAPSGASAGPDELDAVDELLAPYRTELGLPRRAHPAVWAEDFDQQLEVVVEERVPVISFTFGTPGRDAIHAVTASGAITVGTATTTAEARALEADGVDVICAQGAEAGGHHGSWLTDEVDSLVGTFALTQLVCDAVRLPVVAAGGIMDARGVAAALCLGAGAAQMGTAFLLCDEAGTHEAHRRAIHGIEETDVVTTTAVTGRLARGVRNRLISDLRGTRVPPYPVMNALTTEIRRTAAAAGDPQLMAMWCGQAARLAGPISAADLLASIPGGLRSSADVLSAVAGTAPDWSPAADD